MVRHRPVAQMPELWPEAKEKYTTHTHSQAHTHTLVLQQVWEYLERWVLFLIFYLLNLDQCPPLQTDYSTNQANVKPKTEPQETPLSPVSTALTLSGSKDTVLQYLSIPKHKFNCSPEIYWLLLTQLWSTFETPLKHFRDTFKSLNGPHIFTTGLSK